MKKLLGLAAILAVGLGAGCSDDEDDPPPGSAPPVPIALDQFFADGVTRLGPGEVTGEDRVVVEAQVDSDPPGLSVRLVVEVTPAGSLTASPVRFQSPFVSGGSTIHSALSPRWG